jgi:hypothetical protein
MIVYLHGSPEKLPVAEHTLIIAPAGHRPKEFESAPWWDDSGEKRKPLQFEIKFFHGEAETTDEIGRYLIATGQAMKNRLVLPNSWNR